MAAGRSGADRRDAVADQLPVVEAPPVADQAPIVEVAPQADASIVAAPPPPGEVPSLRQHRSSSNRRSNHRSSPSLTRTWLRCERPSTNWPEDAWQAVDETPDAGLTEYIECGRRAGGVRRHPADAVSHGDTNGRDPRAATTGARRRGCRRCAGARQTERCRHSRRRVRCCTERPTPRLKTRRDRRLSFLLHARPSNRSLLPCLSHHPKTPR